MVGAVQIGSAVTGFVAAALWFWSAAGKAPPSTYEGSARLESFLDRTGKLNRWAAGVTAVSVLLSAAATLLQGIGGS